MDAAKVVFCTTCKNRTGHLRHTLPDNLSENKNSHFVVLDYNSGDDLLEFLKSFSCEIKDRRLSVYSYSGSSLFRMAHAKNLAHRLGIMEGGAILVNLDADNFAGPKFDLFAKDMFSRGPQVFLWANMIKGEMHRGISGRIAVSPQAFYKVGGYDEKFSAWASDDKDLNIRLRMIDYQGIEIDRKFLYCIRHNDKIRFKDYPHLLNAGDSEFAIDAASIQKSVVNEGKIGCGTVYRNFDRDDVVEVKPVASRIFGIGFPKTGTSSLNRAFKILGLDSWHWSSAHIAKKIWQEMSNGNTSPTLERWQSLCDLPIPLLYRKLDTAYPGSKFVLTIRKESEWLESIRKHFLSEYNPWKSGWDNDPFSHRVHHLAYGRKDFDAEVFLTRYRQHNSEVQEFFRCRPESLLLLHLDRGDGWQRLCSFIGKTCPDVPFPHENKSLVTESVMT